jgi:hypothetical protein
MNKEVCKHYEEKAVAFRTGEQRIKWLTNRIMSLKRLDSNLLDGWINY